MKMERIPSPRRTMDSAVLLAQPVLHGMVSTGLLLFLILAAAILVFGGHSRRETVKGEVVSEAATTLVTEYPGSIAELRVKIGDPVRQGQIVAVIRVARIIGKEGDRATMGIQRLREMEANIVRQRSEARAQLANLRAGAASLPRNQEAALSSLRQMRAASQEQRQIAETRVAALHRLEQRGFAAKTAVDDARAAILTIESAIDNSLLNEAEIRRQHAEYALTLQTQSRSVEQALLQLDNQYLEIESQIHDLEVQQFVSIAATTSGQVAALSIRPGERVESGQRLMAVADGRARLIVALKVPDGAIGFIEPGQRVVLKYDAYPYQMFGVKYGRVRSVSRSAMPGDAAPAGPAAAPEAAPKKLFLVEVTPESQSILALGQARPLRIGMGVTAEVQLERRRLIQWMLEPLYAIRGQL